MEHREGRYLAMTPLGAVLVGFPDGEPNTFTGDARAIEYLKHDMRERTNRFGQIITPESVRPFDFYFFCQPEGSGIHIFPPADDVIALEALP